MLSFIKTNLIIYFFMICGLCCIVAGCNPTKYLKEDELLLTKNTYKFKNTDNIEQERQFSYELNQLTRQKPNSRILFVFPFRMWLYMMGSKMKNKDSKFSRWLLTKAGEKPVASDTFLLKRSALSMQNYLRNAGYFEASVTAKRDSNSLLSIKPKRLKTRSTQHIFNIQTGNIYKVDTVKYDFDNQNLQELLRETAQESFIKKGSVVNQKNFENERKRMNRLFKNNGFFYFSPSVIEFEGDSLAGNIVQVSIKIDSAFKYQPLRVHNITVYSDIQMTLDTLNRDYDTSIVYKGINFLEKKPYFIHRNILERAFYFEKNDVFKIDNFDKTLKRLRELGVYRFTDIRFEPNASGDSINCMIRLTPAKRMATNFDFDVRNAAADNAGIGASLGFTVRHKNLFKGAEQFNFTVEPGAEGRIFGENIGFRSLLFRIQAGLMIPRLLVPFKIVDGELRNRANTRFDINYSYQDLDSTRFKSRIFGLSGGYDWYETSQKRHQYFPLSIAFQNITADESITQDNIYLIRTFEPRLIIGSSYNFTYNSTPTTKGFSWFFKGGFDMAGNLPYLAQKWGRWDGKIFDISYSQFIKFDTDFRFYYPITRRSQFASRASIGWATPYGKSLETLGEEIPFGKQFFVGGANSIRAWNIRKLGPGSDTEFQSFANQVGYQTGDSKLELSLEYRFDVFEYLKGAIFIDAGNVWNSRSLNSNSHFRIDQFTNQIAVGTGFGLRFDFSYFILRADLAWATRYPYKQISIYDPVTKNYSSQYDENGSYWRSSTFQRFFESDWRSPQFNLALGYPF